MPKVFGWVDDFCPPEPGPGPMAPLGIIPTGTLTIQSGDIREESTTAQLSGTTRPGGIGLVLKPSCVGLPVNITPG